MSYPDKINELIQAAVQWPHPVADSFMQQVRAAATITINDEGLETWNFPLEDSEQLFNTIHNSFKYHFFNFEKLLKSESKKQAKKNRRIKLINPTGIIL